MLTAEQRNTLSAALVADPTAMIMINAGDENGIIAYVNTVGTYQVWRSTTPVSEISDAIIWANFTPANPAAGAGQDFLNWCAQCSIKRDNLWILLTSNSNGFVNTGKHNIQAGLQDALTTIPSGVAGANRAGGWPAVQLVIQRPATYGEKVFATGVGTTVSPGDMTVEGLISQFDIGTIMFNDNGTRKI